MSINEIRTTPPHLSVPKSIRKAAGKQFQAEMDPAVPVRPPQTGAKELPAALTNSEQDYFEKLFPHSAEEVKKYNPYQKNGGNVEVRLGILLDRRG